jgi:hypothetical protein
VRNENFILPKYLHVQPSETERMQYWEYQYMMQDLNDYIEEENERNKKQDAGVNINSMRRDAFRQARSSMPKMPSAPGMPKMPTGF